jgi:hypothetical protein
MPGTRMRTVRAVSAQESNNRNAVNREVKVDHSD